MSSALEIRRFVSRIRTLADRDRHRCVANVALQAAITLGIESGDAGDLDMEAIKIKARQLSGLDAS